LQVTRIDEIQRLHVESLLLQGGLPLSLPLLPISDLKRQDEETKRMRERQKHKGGFLF
jgi:hypothetical protein